MRSVMVHAALASLVVAGAPWATGAEDQPEHERPVEEVVVTGTSIRGIDPVGTAVRNVDREELLATGVASTADIVRALPQFISLGAQEGQGGFTQNAAANVTQGTGINLRGIGTGSTLVLLEGRRLAPNGIDWQYNDVSMFPALALEEVEVIADGASAIYGSDAVAGVANFIMRRDFEGAETVVSTGSAEDLSHYQLGQVFGKVWDSGDAFLAYEYFDRDALAASDRDFLSADLRPFGGPDRRSNRSNPGTIVADGTTYAVPPGHDGTGLAPADLTAGTENLLDPAQTRDYLADQERHSAVFVLRQDLNDRLGVSLEGFYAQRDFVNQGGAAVGISAPSAALQVPSSNPFFVHPGDPDADSVTVNYSFADDLNSYARGFEKTWQGALTLDYQLGDRWTVEAFVARSQVKARRLALGQLRVVNLADVLADPDPDTAFNPFGDHVAQNPATIDRLSGFTDLNARYVLDDVGVRMDGELFRVPGGDVRVAFGAEYYEATGDSYQTRNTATPTTTVSLDSTASRDVQAVYGELFVPLVGPDNAGPLAQSLELSLAVRHEDYSDFGTTSNPKVGLSWSPTDSLTFRGSYGTSFRAPTLKDIDADGSATYNVVDFVDPQSEEPSGLTHGIELLGGREGIDPEEADTFTLGVDWHPQYAPGARVSLTYFDIDYSNRVDTVPSATALANELLLGEYIIREPTSDQLQAIYDSPYYKGTPEPYQNMQIIVDSRRKNLGGEKQSGLDASADYSVGAWLFGADVTYVLEAERSLLPGTRYEDVLDTFDNPIELRARLRAGWRRNSWHADAFLHHVGDYENNQVTPAADVSSWTTVDVTAGYRFEDVNALLDGLSVSLSARNLFDRDPPVVINGSQAFDPTNHSPLGRVLSLKLIKKW